MSIPSDNASRKELLEAAWNSEWKKVCELYKDEKVQGLHINSANDTLLHVAISDATQEIVLDLLNIVNNNKAEMCKILSSKNITGDTPLHLAATLGLERVCRRIAKMCPDMVTSARNIIQETPLFSAVRHGKKNAFFVLEVAIHKEQNLTIDKHCLSERDITHCRRDDGNNILHYAIKGEQFGMAYEIICLYPKLVNRVNSSGETALHILANQPFVFKSGFRFGLYDTILYHYTTTKPLKFHFADILEDEKKNIEDIKAIENIQEYEYEVLPPTCRVCFDLFSLLKHFTCWIVKTVACKACSTADEENPAGAQEGDEYKPSKNRKQRRWFPQNYDTIIFFFEIIVGFLSVIPGIGLRRHKTVKQFKQQHENAKKIMEELVDRSTHWEYKEATDREEDIGLLSDIGPKFPPMITSRETTDLGFNEKTPLYLSACASASPVLVAAMMGITEMVKRILEKYPVAINDKDQDNKNIVLLAVEYRQVNVYKYMLGVRTTECVFQKVDKNDNSVLHIAAMFSHNHPWSSGAALQMNWEFKWYKYVASTITRYLDMASIFNKDGQMPYGVFIESHGTLIKDGTKWLTSISQSCSTVAALFATVTFASVSAFPGGPDQSGFPIFSKTPAFQLFTISSLVALCFSVTSLLMFLAILTSSFKVEDFERGLPMKLILGLTSLFVAIASSLVSFCAGDLFVVKENLKLVVYPIDAVMGFAFIFFAVAHYPLCIELIESIRKKVPERTRKISIY